MEFPSSGPKERDGSRSKKAALLLLFERISLSSLWFEMSLCLTHAIHSFLVYPREIEESHSVPGSAVSFLPFRASQTVGSTNGMVWLGNIYPSQRSQSYDWIFFMYIRKSSVFLQKEESVNLSISASPTRKNGPPFLYWAKHSTKFILNALHYNWTKKRERTMNTLERGKTLYI